MEAKINKKEIIRQIGAKIAYNRTLRGLSQETLAARINISKSVISKIERGNYNVGVTILLDIAQALDIEPAKLFTFDEAEKLMWTQPEENSES